MRLILLHGWTMDSSAFDKLRQALPEIETIAPDLPGHGTAMGDPPTLDACADRLHALLMAGPAAVLGWSMGAAVAWRCVSRYGLGNLSRLITVDMSPRLLSAPDWPHGIKGQDGDAQMLIDKVSGDWPGIAQGIAQTMFARGHAPEGWDIEATAAAIAARPRAAMLALWRELVGLDERAVIANITCPWLIVHGARSRVYPASAARWLANTAPCATRFEFQHAGHAPHLEEPDLFAQTVRTFLEVS